MSYKKDDKSFLPAIRKLITTNEEVLVDIYTKSSYSTFYFIKSLNEFEDILNKLSAMDYITVYKKKQLPVRGILSLEFIEKALREYDNKNYNFIIYTYVFYPKCLCLYGHGETLNDLKQRLNELLHDFGEKNLNLCFGVDPEPETVDINLKENNDFILISGATTETPRRASTGP